MKTLKYWLVVLGGVLALATAQAANLDFELVNNTGVDIYEVFVSPSDVEEWGDDILEQDILEDGMSVEISFDPEEEAALWDLMVKDGEGNSIYWEELDLTQISTFKLSMETSAQGDEQE